MYAGNGRAWLHLANAGNGPSVVRVSFVRDRARRVVQEVNLGAGEAATLPADTRLGRASGAIVEYAGGEVFASRTAVFDAPIGLSRPRRGAVAAPCSRAGGSTLIVASASTFAAESTIVLLNPSSGDAVVDVSFVEQGDEITPEKLTRFIVPARGRRQVRAGDYAFDVRAVSAVVRVRSGRVVADGLVASGGGLTLSPGLPPAGRLVALGTTAAGSARLDVAAPGEQDALVEATTLSPGGPNAFSPLASEVAANAPKVAGLAPAKTEALGVSLLLREGSPLAATAVWAVPSASGSGDFAASDARPPARRLVAVAGAPAAAPQAKLLVANPNEGTATFSVTLLTSGGPVSSPALSSVSLGPGRAIALRLGAGSGPFGVALTADLPLGATLAASVPGKDSTLAFAVSGTEVRPRRPVRVALDRRLGIPA